MKITARAKVLRDITTRMHAAATRSLAPKFEGNRVTITASAGAVTFAATNGYLAAEVRLDATTDPSLGPITPGLATVLSSDLHQAVTAAAQGFDDHALQLRCDTKRFYVGQAISIPTLTNHVLAGQLPAHGPAATVSAADFCYAVNAVAKYQTKSDWKARYRMLLFDWVGAELRVVCGDGMRFAIVTLPYPTAQMGQLVMPADQAVLISRLVSAAGDLVITSARPCECTVTADTALRMCLTRIPAEPYIPYHRHAYRTGEAQAILDVPTRALKAAMRQQYSAVTSKRSSSGLWRARPSGRRRSLPNYSPVAHVTTSAAGMRIRREEAENARSCDVTVPARYYDLMGLPAVDCYLTLEYLRDVANTPGQYARFYCNESSDTVLVDSVDLYPAYDDYPPDIQVHHVRLFFAKSTVDDE